MEVCLLGCFHVCRVAAPHRQWRGLESATVGESHFPGSADFGRQPVDGVEVHRRLFIVLPAGQKHDARDRRRDGAAEAGDGFFGHFIGVGSVSGVLARNNHVGFEERAFQIDPLESKLVVDFTQGRHRGLEALVYAVVSVHQNFGRYDRNQIGLLAQGGESGQQMRVGLDAVSAWDAVADGDDRPPLGEPGAQFVILGQPVSKAVQAVGDKLAAGA